MCYVIYTGAGRESTAKALILKLVPPELYSRVFYPFRHMRKKIAGDWADIYEWLIPGYIFVITDRVNDFYAALRRVPRLTKLLGTVVDATGRASVGATGAASPGNFSRIFTPITDTEEEWLRALLGDNWFDPSVPPPDSDSSSAADSADNAVAALSMIDFDENDRVRILSGPLMTLSALVRRIDLHHRYAEVEVGFMGTTQRLRLGFEILKKDS